MKQLNLMRPFCLSFISRFMLIAGCALVLSSCTELSELLPKAAPDPLVYSDTDQATGLTYPTFNAPVNPTPSQMPDKWNCTALLHPYSPPPANDPKPNSPFYQLCLANITYVTGQGMSIQLKGEEYGEWWYEIRTSDRKQFLSTDKGTSWNEVDMGWTVPPANWLENATNVGSAYLNWMEAQMVDWWKSPVPGSNASTWIWMNTAGDNANLPFRLMFGAPPPSPTKGDPKQLPLFQNFSFTYLVNWKTENVSVPSTWSDPVIDGFTFGNPKNYEKFVWDKNFAMTTFMTPVDEKSNPLPTRVMYTWKPDGEYKQAADRAQNTLMWYNYNPQSNLLAQEALLFGASPEGVQPPAHSGAGYLINADTNGLVSKCEKMPLGAEPPNWASVPGVNGTIHADISSNKELSPKVPMMIVSVTFPPTKEYPQGRYLWTWYSPLSSNGLEARPVTFMESASNIAEGGTSLALADYYSYKTVAEWFPADNYEVPSACDKKE